MHLLRGFRSLRWRFLLPFALLLALALGGMSLYLAGYIRQSTLATSQSALLRETRLVAEQIGPGLSPGLSAADVQAQVAGLAAQLGVRITIIAPDGRVLADSDADPAGMENHGTRPEVQQALAGVESTQMRESATLKASLLYAAVPVRQGARVVAVTRLALPITTIESDLAVMRRTLALATLTLIALALGLTWLLARHTVRPLEELTVAVQKLGAGEFSDAFLAEREDELGLLNRAFTRMAFQLNGKIVELETERGKLAAVLANMTDGVIIVDAEGVMQLINPAAARMFHTSVEAAGGRSLAEVTRQHQLVELWRQSLAGGDQQATLIEISLERLFLQAIATPLGKMLPGSTLLLLQDFTRVRRLETVRRDFVSNVSHELRTPLASLKALTETLQEGALEDPPAARRFLAQMDNEIDNLTQMVRELLELSRIESGRVPLERRRTSVYSLVDQVIERMHLQAERAGLTLAAELPPDLPAVALDSARMEQVFVNLVHNAVKFTGPGGRINISAQVEGDAIVFSIRDSGVGINADDLSRIFERFYKADRARTGGGTGLGLSIARHLVEAHGGQIWAASQMGQGSTFSFSIPLNR